MKRMTYRHLSRFFLRRRKVSEQNITEIFKIEKENGGGKRITEGEVNEYMRDMNCTL